MQTRMPLATLAIWAHCWLMFSRLLSSIPSTLSEQFSSCSLPSLYCSAGLLCHKLKTQHLAIMAVECHTIGFGPLTQPIYIPLQSLPTPKQINSAA